MLKMYMSFLNSRWIKLIAIITMTFDHVGVMLFPGVLWLRVIGRISMPLFCLLIAYGSVKTKNQAKYVLRLFVFAVLVQMGFNVFEHGSVFAYADFNIFFTLALGAMAIWFIKMGENKGIFSKLIMVFGIILTFALTVALPIGAVSYGIAGIFLIVLFWFGIKFEVLKIAALFAVAAFCLIYYLTYDWTIIWYAMLSVPFIMLFADKKLKISIWEKYGFYIYYPLHFAVIYGISLLI